VHNLWAMKSEDVGIIVVQLHVVSKIFNLCGHDPLTLQTDGQKDKQTTCDSKAALCTIVHRAVKTCTHIDVQTLSGLPSLNLLIL